MKEIETWQDIVDFMNETCPTCGCFLNNWPECGDGCIHVTELENCPQFRERVPMPGEPDYETSNNHL
jgi:hypothetical protein